MTPEAQRIAIAEACGWECVTKKTSGRTLFRWEHSRGAIITGLCGGVGGNGWHSTKDASLLPDYLSDLNAMHEAENVLGEKRIRSYAFTLAQVLDTLPTVDLDDQFLNIHATAAQRAEAFLRTLNLWTQ